MTDTPSGGEEKKIIIDEDWKSRVEAEREQAKKEPARPEGEPSQAAEEHGPLPPPSLELVISTFAMQAMISLGVIADPTSGKGEVHLDAARHFIDTVELLKTKTEGNRTPEESELIDKILSDLRLSYVAVSQRS